MSVYLDYILRAAGAESLRTAVVISDVPSAQGDVQDELVESIPGITLLDATTADPVDLLVLVGESGDFTSFAQAIPAVLNRSPRPRWVLLYGLANRELNLVRGSDCERVFKRMQSTTARAAWWKQIGFWRYAIWMTRGLVFARCV